MSAAGLFVNAMSWVTIIWSMNAAACLTMGAMQLMVWCRNRNGWANLVFCCSAVSAAIIAGFELAGMRSESTAQMGLLLRWANLPFFVLIVSLVWFVRLYLGAGRLWLAWTICSLRGLVLALNFLFTPNFNYREITKVDHLHWWGGETVSVPAGVANPWVVIGQLSLLLTVIFCLDAAICVWRRGDKRRAVVVGGSAVVFISLTVTQTVLLVWGFIRLPFMHSLAYLGIIVAMA